MPSIPTILIKRSCGGWLAVSVAAEPIKIGVTGATESEARDNYAATLRRWREILELPWTPKEPWPPGTFDNMPVPRARYGRRRVLYRRSDAQP